MRGPCCPSSAGPSDLDWSTSQLTTKERPVKKLLVILVILAFAVPCLAQTAQPPKPGPEVQKLAYTVGTWKVEGETKAGPFGPAGKFSGTDTCEWFAGGFHMVCRGEGTGPEGKTTDLVILAYDVEAKAYTYHYISSRGESGSSKGSLTGGTWTWLWDGKAVGKPAKYRLTEVEVSPTSSTFKLESAVAGGPWTVIEEGKSTKVK